jgi:hypothetical protein
MMEKGAESTGHRKAFGGLRESEWLWVISSLAGLRVFFFLSGFPFYGNVDEINHIELVHQFVSDFESRTREEHLEATGRLLVLYTSPEYSMVLEKIPKGPPNYRIADIDKAAEFDSALAEAKRLLSTNHEVGSPPVYYFLLACWSELGSVLGVSGLHLLYWLRLPNIAAAMALVWLGFVITHRWFPRRPQLAWGVAILLAAMPQDVFYVVNPDVLSAVLFPLALHRILIYGEGRKATQAGIAGLIVGLLMLVKLSNVPILAPMLLVSAAVIFRPTAGSSLPRAVVATTLLWALPCMVLGSWMLWNQWTIGEWTATAERFQILGWTTKPIGEIFNHPILHPSGLGYFLSKLIMTFWQGESVWWTEWMHLPWLDFVYVSTSLVFVGATIVTVVAWRLKGRSSDEPWGTMIATVAAAVLWMAYLSTRFDFGPCFYPSRELPYFVSGRLIFGVAIPFAILYVGGLSFLWTKLAGKASFLPVLVGLAVVLTLGELLMTIPVFSSQYNWLRLWP